MRHFVVHGHDAPTTADFDLSDLAGGAGRLDVLCRCVGAGLFLSHGVREDVRVSLVLADELTVRFEGSEIRYLNPDERNIAGMVRKAIGATDRAIGHREAEPSPGVYVSKRGFAPTVEAAARGGTVVQLHEDGRPLADVEPPETPVFVLSDHRDFTDAEASLLADASDERVRVGPAVLHADHTIAVAHNYLDTRGYTRY
ncbi:tRNA (pseudouridine(54)-N(1))-methyltransferase TrmY [Halarchaeum nitratireducens]|uniref:tRNA (pseudouridine(54)-N(1))-methyltransferase n=1 Tax=Halarchaeum nitratireducens TaxID=489913 RepID=A0A830G7S2_9EURY|nr:tRNA (pseudouridine(54)-N(1))-methyltransferase TrmY [Halarchaeum nitratireducens]GGN06924.1 tRNA (pseudouridine(54)-N(1))-methyltransferase TrmY [Halarchaeum nitratireducens]